MIVSGLSAIIGNVSGLSWNTVQQIAMRTDAADRWISHAIFPVIGDAVIERADGQNVSAIVTPSDRTGYNVRYAPDNAGNIIGVEYAQKTTWVDSLVPILSIALVAGGVSGAFDSFTSGAQSISPLSDGATATGFGESDFANETAKLMQQQSIAQSGGDILSTSLPTIDLSNVPIPSSLPSATGASASMPVAQVAGAVPAVAGAVPMVSKILGATTAGSKNVTPVTGAMPSFDNFAAGQLSTNQGTIQPWMIYSGIGVLVAIAALTSRRRRK